MQCESLKTRSDLVMLPKGIEKCKFQTKNMDFYAKMKSDIKILSDIRLEIHRQRINFKTSGNFDLLPLGHQRNIKRHEIYK